MKLVYLSESMIPSREANAVHVMKMCNALAELGHQVTLIAPDIAHGGESTADPFAFYGVERCFELRKLTWPSFKGRAFLYGWLAGRYASSHGFDAAYGRSLHACATAARYGVPTRWDTHMPYFLRRPHERRLFKWMINARAFRGVTTNCDALRRVILTEVPELEGRIVALHNGADPIGEDVAPLALGERGNRLQVGYVGQLYPGKGLEIIRPLAALAPFADFHVIGGETNAIASLQRDLELPANIRVHGFVPPADVKRLLLAFDVLLAPYKAEVRTAGGGETAAWMSPLKLFDYMAAGKPILCSDLPVLREIIEDGQNGILISPDDPSAWARALEALKEDSAARVRIGANARADLFARHTWRHRAERALNGL